jgi:hypothetical protein
VPGRVEHGPTGCSLRSLPVPDEPELPEGGPTALPSVPARAVAFAVILVAGLCGGLIGRALVQVQCSGSCSTASAVGALAGALTAAGGVAVVAVLVLRAMGEWRAGPGAPPR